MKRRVHELLEIDQNGDLQSRWVDSALMLLIVANVAAIVASTEGVVEENAARYLYYFELVSFCIFGVEYLLRVWSCTANDKYAHPVGGRLRYMFRPLMLADATAVVSFFIILLLPSGVDLGALRVIRLLSRLASLARYSAGMQGGGGRGLFPQERTAGRGVGYRRAPGVGLFVDVHRGALRSA